MAKHSEMDLLDKAVEITVSAVSGCGDKPAYDLTNAQAAADYIQAVFDKLRDINETLAD